MKDLIRKYNIPGPRYTSYPTVPHWNNTPSEKTWLAEVKKMFDKTNESDGISLYIHLPYCESMCSYCGCNMRVSKNHQVELPYIELVLKEWELYKNELGAKPVIKELHLGGGTPTFFSPKNLRLLVEQILKDCTVSDKKEFSFEAHPKNTSKEHLETLFELGFRRLSLGIQDFDPTVQDIINRIQPYDMVDDVVKMARLIGYESINFDLIYGLPKQTVQSINDTISKVKLLEPDRIAFYSYAHVPWDRKMQRKFTEADLPADEEKRKLYEEGKLLLVENGFHEIGMDHFAIESDSMYIAMTKGTLHRNFMGYTNESTKLSIGLGVSSISDSWTCYMQNEKSLEAYKEKVLNGAFPIFRGHQLSADELSTKDHILNLMCQFKTNWKESELLSETIQKNFEKLSEMVNEQLIDLNENSLKVTDKGKTFVRNVCMLVDPKIKQNVKQNQFSKTI